MIHGLQDGRMRAKEFLLEYSRQTTANQFGSAMFDRAIKGPDRNTFMHAYYRNDAANVDRNKVVDMLLREIERADPTPNKTYAPWLAREYAKGNIRRVEDLFMLTPGLETHSQYKKKGDFPPELKDIMRVSAPDFHNAIETYSPTEKEIKNRGNAQEVYNDDTVRVIVPNDEEAACYYGQGTRWCTAATEGANYFNHYNKQGKLYILLPKKTKHDGEKYQLHFGSDQFMNEGDDPIDVSELLHNRFPSLIEFFTKVEPGLKNLIVFAPDNILKPICNKVAEIAEELIWDTLTEWEMNDDYYQIWRKEEAEKRGYVDSEGEVDWEKVYDDDDLNNYLQYSDEAHQYYNQAMECIQLTPHQAKQLAKVYAAEVGESPRITDYDRMIAGNIVENMGKHDADLADKIERTVMITSTPDGYQVKTVVR